MTDKKPHGMIGIRNACKSDDKKLATRIALRMTKDEYNQWLNIADKEGLQLSEWIRSKLNLFV